MISEKTNVKLLKEVPQKTCYSDVKPLRIKDIIKRQFLHSFLNRAASIFIIKNSFAKFQFQNSNSYLGWLNSNGFHGFGTYVYENGACLKGTFEGSLSKGLGSLTYINGDIYEGEFLAGRQHGYGQYKAEQFKYSGCFQNGKYHGKGVWKTRTEEVEGIFLVGKVKSGEARDCSGVFNGTFDNSDLRKWGKFTFQNGNTYDGCWTDNKFAGFGEYNWISEKRHSIKEKTKYVGYWWNGKQHGLGMLTFNERCVICQWSCGKKSGAGIIITANGSCYCSKELFIDDQYKESQCIRNCLESQNMLSKAIQILTSDSKYGYLDEKVNAFLNIVKSLLVKYSLCFSPINPICIPNYEIPPGSFSSSLESKHLQQVLVENYTTFKILYKKYTHPADECLNHIGLNLFYIDVFHKVRDINIMKCLKAGHFAITQSCFNSPHNTNCDNLIGVVLFYEFFQHFVFITNVLMENETLRTKANEIRPTFFGELATKVLLVLRMLQTNEISCFRIREVFHVNYSNLIKLIQLLEEIFPGEKCLRTAYKFLKAKNVIEGKSTEFLQTIEEYNDVSKTGFLLFDNHYELSNLELIEIIFRTYELKLTNTL